MNEITEQAWLERLKQNETFAVFVYTPMCGTCQVGKKMLEVIMEMNAAQQIYQCNILFMKQLQKDFEIESVPCFMLFQEGKMLKKVYAMQSVPYLYEITEPLRNVN